MTARFIVGDTRAVTATFPDGSVELVLSSTPYLALRSYLPADHPSKHLEIGSEATPADFINVLLALTAEWRRVLNPRTGSIVIELGDTYAGSGIEQREAVAIGSQRWGGADGMPTLTGAGAGTVARKGDAWPRPKSATLIPESYRWALAYGRNPFTGEQSPAGRWQVRNTITRCSPNPPVGALGKKWRPATTDLVVATPDDDRRYWDDIATRVEPGGVNYGRQASWNNINPKTARAGHGADRAGEVHHYSHPAGAPLLDWWQIVAGGYPGAHYAVYPPELVEPFIEAMCPRRVCQTCGEPSRRIFVDNPEYEGSSGGTNTPERGFSLKGIHHKAYPPSAYLADGWTTCGCPGTDGHRLDGYHTGTGWRPGIVLDPFAGTFTTGAVATGHGRDAIGIDLDERNASLALDRVGPLLLTIEHHELVA